MKIRYYFLGILFTLALFFVGNQLGFKNLDTIFWDRLQEVYTTNVRDDITIVGIDEDSLSEIGAWPWKRDVFADVINKLNENGARVIGMDITFLDPREGDEELQEAASNSESIIILASKIVDDEHLHPVITDVRLGFTNILQGSDGIVREMLFDITVNAEEVRSFAKQIYFAYTENHPRKDVMQAWFNELPDPAPFIYGAGNFNTISVVDLLNDDYDPTMIKDKIIIIGSTVNDLRLGLDDNVSKIGGIRISGAMLHGYFVSALLDKATLVQSPFILNFGVMTLFVIGLLLIFARTKSSIYDVIIAVGVSILIFIGSILLFDIGYLIPAISYIITIFAVVIYNLIDRYINEKKSKQFISKAFSQYMSSDLLGILMKNPKLLRLGGQKRELSMLFSDIRDFTSWAETASPEELVSLLNSYMDKMSNVIFDHSGVIDKFIGDAVVALWNSPIDDEKHAKHAVQTAIAMMEALKEFNEGLCGTELKMGIGVHTGEVVVGNMGSTRRFEFTVIGDDVNITDRMLGLTKKYGVDILISGDTVKKAGGIEGYVFRKIDDVIVKGKRESMSIYQPMPDNAESLEIKANYEEAFEKYQAGEMDEALRLLGKNAEDFPSKLLIHRIESIKAIPDDWNGVWKWKEK